MSKLKAMVISVGIVNMTTGKTEHDWSIYENTGLHAFLTSNKFLMFGTPDTFEIGDEVTLHGNDSGRKLQSSTITDSAPCNKEELLAMLLKHNFDYYPSRPFQKKRGLDFRGKPRKLKTSYSVKGTLNN